MWHHLQRRAYTVCVIVGYIIIHTYATIKKKAQARKTPATKSIHNTLNIKNNNRQKCRIKSLQSSNSHGASSKLLQLLWAAEAGSDSRLSRPL